MYRWPKIPLGLRLFSLYFLLVGLTAYMVSQTLIQELKPTVRQSSEETLVDMANLLAVLAEDDVANGTLSQSRFARLLTTYGQRPVRGHLWASDHISRNHRIYITNQQGIVIADSWQQDVGQDYSQWNDVYLTLRGQYGARSTAEDPNDPSSSVMYVAAPIYHHGNIIGTVTVAKANRSVQPFIDVATRHVLYWLVGISGLVLMVGALFAWRTHSALHRLDDYAKKMGAGEKIAKPMFRIFYEYGTLSDALENLRNQLDGKQYVEEYVQTLTHELKSPLSAIKGASEILQMPLPEEKIARFAQNIEGESERMRALIDKLLELARLEKHPGLETLATISIEAMLNDIVQASEGRLSRQMVTCRICVDGPTEVAGDAFLLRQALFNLMDNALDFVDPGGVIECSVIQTAQYAEIAVYNTGPLIPDYALSRLTERFYSLPRKNGVKSTGLGLNFVEQVMALHQGSLLVENVTQGVKVTLSLPTP